MNVNSTSSREEIKNWIWLNLTKIQKYRSDVLYTFLLILQSMQHSVEVEYSI